VLVKPPSADGLVDWLTTHLIEALRKPAVMRIRTRIDQVDLVQVCRIDVAVFGAGDRSHERQERGLLGPDEQQHPVPPSSQRRTSTSGTTGAPTFRGLRAFLGKNASEMPPQRATLSLGTA
jgi:hypothetical protein